MLQNQMHCHILVRQENKKHLTSKSCNVLCILHLGCSLKKLSNCFCVCSPLGFFMVLHNWILLSWSVMFAAWQIPKWKIQVCLVCENVCVIFCSEYFVFAKYVFSTTDCTHMAPWLISKALVLHLVTQSVWSRHSQAQLGPGETRARSN